MDTIISRLLFSNWPRKFLALFAAIVIWFFVNHSITTVKTIPHVPVRFVNIPQGKTIHGLLPNGILAKRATLTLSGTKNVIESLEPGDIEVHIDAANNPDEWIIQINKKNLVSLNPDVDLNHHVTQVTHNEFVIKMSRLTKVAIPIEILPPLGSAPKGYQFLDIWPQELTHTVEGPEKQMQTLQSTGIDLQFNLNDITKADLDALQVLQGSHNDEISFLVPNKWKEISIPFPTNVVEEINNPAAAQLHINFLRQEFIPIQDEIPIRVFYPSKNTSTINPRTHTLVENEIIKLKNGIYYLSIPLFTLDVSKVFLETIKDHLEISIIANPEQKNDLSYSIETIHPQKLEDRYVTAMLNNLNAGKNTQDSKPQDKDREENLRMRFREYMKKFDIYTSTHELLVLNIKLEGNQIKVDIQSDDSELTK